MTPQDPPIPDEFSRAADDAVGRVAAVMAPARKHPGDGWPGFDWTVAVPVVVGSGIPIAHDAPEATARRILFAHEDATGLDVIRPGDRLAGVGGTRGHMVWPPETAVFEVLSGSLAGTRVQFVLDPDPRPAGEAAVTAARVLLRTDEPVLADPVRLEKLHAAISRSLASRLGD